MCITFYETRSVLKPTAHEVVYDRVNGAIDVRQQVRYQCDYDDRVRVSRVCDQRPSIPETNASIYHNIIYIFFKFLEIQPSHALILMANIYEKNQYIYLSQVDVAYRYHARHR